MKLIVEDMSCSHCVAAITKALESKDPQAKVKTDLTTKQVDVFSSLSVAEVSAIIKDTGYSVKAMD